MFPFADSTWIRWSSPWKDGLDRLANHVVEVDPIQGEEAQVVHGFRGRQLAVERFVPLRHVEDVAEALHRVAHEVERQVRRVVASHGGAAGMTGLVVIEDDGCLEARPVVESSEARAEVRLGAQGDAFTDRIEDGFEALQL